MARSGGVVTPRDLRTHVAVSGCMFSIRARKSSRLVSSTSPDRFPAATGEHSAFAQLNAEWMAVMNTVMLHTWLACDDLNT